MTCPSERERLFRIRLRRGRLVCLVAWPSIRGAGRPQLAIIASLRSPHLRRWRVFLGQRPATPLRPVPQAV